MAMLAPSEDFQEKTGDTWRPILDTVVCARCGGLMVVDRCFDLLDDTGHLRFLARRCVQCGEVIDPVILRNRRLRSHECLTSG